MVGNRNKHRTSLYIVSLRKLYLSQKTLNEPKLEALTKAIVDNVAKQTGAVLRG